MCVDINEHKFEGVGKTKKFARMEAAQKAVEFLLKNPEYIQKAAKTGQSSSSTSSQSGANNETSQKSVGEDLDDDEIGGEDENEDDDDDDSSCSASKKLKTETDE